ncbi:MAG: polysaccharide biosynthesis protein, partial [Candidatus Omnitrophota bacterium]
AVVVGQVLSVLCLVYFFRFEGYSRSVFIIDGLLLLMLVAGSRVALRVFREFFISLREQGKRILIMGAGDAGEFALREIRNNRRLNYTLVGFIDDDKKKQGYLIHGIPVLGTRRELISIAEREGIKEVLIAIPSVSDKQLSEVYEGCQKHEILCHRMPYVINFNRGEIDTKGGDE